jgi:hypothetical protein
VSQVLAAANAYLGGNGAVALPYGLSSAAELNELVANLNLAFAGKDWDGDTVDDYECGGMTAFAESHLCQPWAGPEACETGRANPTVFGSSGLARRNRWRYCESRIYPLNRAECFFNQTTSSRPLPQRSRVAAISA